MRKISLFIIFILVVFALPTFAADKAKTNVKNKNIIEDELLKHEKFKNIKQHSKKEHTLIKDELLEQNFENDNGVFNLRVFKNDIIENTITDELLNSPDFNNDAIETEITKQIKPEDDFLLKIINPNKMRKIKPKNIYNFTKKEIAIKIKIPEKLKFNNKIKEGDEVSFEAIHDFSIKDKKFEKGTKIIGRIETISQSDKMGVPESIKIDNFYIENFPDINLSGFISKNGANRSIWVYPLYQAGNITFYVAGFVFVPIHGGHAKLHPKETFTLFYETP